MAYQLELPAEARIHNTFHVSLLKKWVGRGVVPEPQLPELAPEKPQPEPAEILNQRSQTSRRKTTKEVLLRWQGQAKEDAVWVEDEWLKKTYPHLEGKVF